MDFTIFWSGQTFSTLGDGIALIALPLLILEATGSVALMGLATGLLGLTQVVTGFFAGPLVDRVDRRILMIYCDSVRLLCFLAIPIVWGLVGPQVWLIFVVVTVCAFLKTLFDVAYVALTTSLVEREQIIEANSRLQATRSLAYVIGPTLAGVLAVSLGPAFAIGIDALTFAVSVLSLVLIRVPPRAADLRGEHLEIEGQGEHHHSREELLIGFRFIWHEPALRTIALLLLIMTLLSSGLIDLVTFHLKHDVGLDNTGVGIMFGLASAGGAVAGIIATRLHATFGPGACWIGGMLLFGLAIVGSVLSNSLVWLSVMALSFTFARILVRIVSVSLQQELSPDHLLGRVSGAFWMMNTAPGPIGAAFLTALAGSLGAPPVLLFIGAICVLLGLVALFTPIRQVHSQPVREALSEEELLMQEETVRLPPSLRGMWPAFYACQHCGTPMPRGAKYCGNCGYSLVDSVLNDQTFIR